MKPPSPIVIEQQVTADQKSDDPLSSNIYMTLSYASGEDREGIYVCAWSARTGLSYIGASGEIVS